MSLIAIVLLLLLLWFPSISIEGAANGLLLWFHVVLPTLAPFLICTHAIISLNGIPLLMRPFYPLFHALFGLSANGSYVLLCGMLCGYPLGAKLCAQFRQSGRMSEKEAQYLFAICNHPSPMFLLGYIRSQIPFPVPAWLLLVCFYAPILPLSVAARFLYRTPAFETQSLSAVQKPLSKTCSMENLIADASETMVLIGGCIMIFSILAAWISGFPGILMTVKAGFTGLTEITIGIHQLCSTWPRDRLLPAIAAITAFGGFSGILQTKSVIKNAGLSIRHYIGWKALHAILSFVLAIVLSGFLPR